MILFIGSGNATDLEIGEDKTSSVSAKPIHSSQLLEDSNFTESGNVTESEIGEDKTPPISTKTIHSPQFLDDLKVKKLKNPCQKLV